MLSRRPPAAVIVMILCAGLVAALPARAQLAPSEPDPLARMRAAATANSEACSAAEISACAQANPKIVSAALASSSLASNLSHLDEMGARVTGTPGMDRAAAGAAAALREAGLDDVRVEDSYGDAAGASGSAKQENVVAEIRGREKPEEFVVLAAHLDSGPPGSESEDNCNAALILEAARDIHLTGLRPRRSIRFVLFSGKEQGMLGSWAYVRAHRAELDHAVAAVIFDGGCAPVTGFSLGGRQDLEVGVREAFSVAPVDSWGIVHDTYDAPLRADDFDFLLEGVPNLLANREPAGGPPAKNTTGSDPKTGLDTLRHNTAIAGVLAFAVAEHATPLGRRLSREEVEALLHKTGLDAQMKQAGIWSDWENGRRGRQP